MVVRHRRMGPALVDDGRVRRRRHVLRHHVPGREGSQVDHVHAHLVRVVGVLDAADQSHPTRPPLFDALQEADRGGRGEGGG